MRDSDTFARHGVSDTAARVGGDEFVLLVDDFVEASDLAALARRILMAAVQPFDLAGPKGRVSASVGISIYPEDADDIDGLIKAADNAMYEAKQGGGNAYRFFSAVIEQQVGAVA